MLANVMRKPLEEMLYEFMEGTIAADEEGHLQVRVWGYGVGFPVSG